MATAKHYISKGATETFYTLRYCSSYTGYSGEQGQYAYDKFDDFHVCTLSKDYETAKAKAEAIVGSPVEFDPASMEWRNFGGNYGGVKPEPFNLDEAEVEFGKYKGRLVLDVLIEDPKYLLWFYNNATGAHKIKKALSGLPAFGEVIDQAEKAIDEALATVPVLANVGDQVEFEMVVEYASLVMTDGNETVYDREYLQLSGYIDDARKSRVSVLIADYNEYVYGYEDPVRYGLPIIEGKAKRVKGKTVKFAGVVSVINEDRKFKSKTTVVSQARIVPPPKPERKTRAKKNPAN